LQARRALSVLHSFPTRRSSDLGTDEEELAQGVGHYYDTGLPGQNKQILLSGHRDTVFRNFDQLEHGDEFHVKMEYGTYIYQINRSEEHTSELQSRFDLVCRLLL